jgi:hypothetical protein
MFWIKRVPEETNRKIVDHIYLMWIWVILRIFTSGVAWMGKWKPVHNVWSVESLFASSENAEILSLNLERENKYFVVSAHDLLATSKVRVDEVLIWLWKIRLSYSIVVHLELSSWLNRCLNEEVEFEGNRLWYNALQMSRGFIRWWNHIRRVFYFKIFSRSLECSRLYVQYGSMVMMVSWIRKESCRELISKRLDVIFF